MSNVECRVSSNDDLFDEGGSCLDGTPRSEDSVTESFRLFRTDRWRDQVLETVALVQQPVK